MSAKTDRNRYMAEYMRDYRARKAAELAELKAKEEQQEPTIEAMLNSILEVVTALGVGQKTLYWILGESSDRF